MEAYAIEHGVYREDGPIPESVYKRGHIRNVLGFIDFCISDALYNNPYKVVPVVYLACIGLLLLCMGLKEYVIIQVSKRLLQKWVVHVLNLRLPIADGVISSPSNYLDLYEKSLDTVASIMPVVVTLVLFLFPPLIANA